MANAFPQHTSGAGIPTEGAPRARAPFHVLTKPIGPICNLDCEYCFYLRKEALYPQGERFRMTEETLRRYITQYFAANPAPVVEFAWQGGEPTLMGVDFFRLVVALQRELCPPGKSFRNALQTNGTLLDDEWGEFLRENRFLVGISVDGPRELHDRYRVDKGQRPTFDRVMRGLSVLQRHQVDFNVLCVVNRVNAHHPLEVYHFFKEQGIQFLQFIPAVEHLGGGQVTPWSVEAEAYGEFLVTIFDEWVRHDVGRIYIQIIEEAFAAYLGMPPSLCIFAETCGRNVALEHNGDVFSCDHFVFPEYKLGNLMEEPLAQLIDSEFQEQFGVNKKALLPRYCRECPVRFVCNGGCPKDRFIRTPDGEEGLNYLCAGYRRFFLHVGPYMRRMGELLRHGLPPAAIMAELARPPAAARSGRATRVGRNDPCPCGSGRKYKQCCMGRVAG